MPVANIVLVRDGTIKLLLMNHLKFSSTPITPLPYYSHLLGVNLLCKRDDLFTEAGGGSKARMLQYILADVNSDKYDVLLTAGGPCSNFNRACALMCAKIGLPMHLVEYTDEPEEFQTSLNYYLCQLADIRTTRCDKTQVPETIAEVLSEYQKASKKVKLVYGGGKSLEGIYAYYDAIEELFKEQIKIDHLFVACGTGTTLTGICAGMQKYFSRAKVHAISTARTYDAEKKVLSEDMKILNEHLGTNYTFDNLNFSEEYLCGGYAQFNKELFDTVKECISKEGMIIDPTYSGKAFWGMVQTIKQNREYQGKNVLFWNTGGIFNLLSTK